MAPSTSSRTSSLSSSSSSASRSRKRRAQVGELRQLELQAEDLARRLEDLADAQIRPAAALEDLVAQRLEDALDPPLARARCARAVARVRSRRRRPARRADPGMRACSGRASFMGARSIPAASRAVQGIRRVAQRAGSGIAARVVAARRRTRRAPRAASTAPPRNSMPTPRVELRAALLERALRPRHAPDRLDLRAVRERELDQHAAARARAARPCARTRRRARGSRRSPATCGSRGVRSSGSRSASIVEMRTGMRRVDALDVGAAVARNRRP